MSLIDELKALRSKRSEHEAAIADIDRQLSQVKQFLNGDTSPAPGFYQSRPRATRVHRDWGELEKEIVAALAVREPQLTSDFKALGSVNVIRFVLRNLVQRGVLVRRAAEKVDGAIGRSAYLYARSAGAFVESEKADEEAAAAVEAGVG